MLSPPPKILIAVAALAWGAFGSAPTAEAGSADRSSVQVHGRKAKKSKRSKAKIRPRKSTSATSKATAAPSAESESESEKVQPIDGPVTRFGAEGASNAAAAPATVKEATAAPAAAEVASSGGAPLAQRSPSALDSPSPSKAPGPREDPWLAVTASMHVFNRNYTYGGDPGGVLPPYRLGMAPAPALLFEVWPLALMGDDILSTLGAFVGYEHALAIASVAQCAPGSTCATARFPTTATAFQAGPQARIPIGPVRLGLRGGYGWRAFTISDANPTDKKPLVPSVSYQFAFARASLRLQLGSFAVDVQGGYRSLFGAGELSSATYFPQLKGYGLEGSAGISYLMRPTELRVSFDIERHTLALNPASTSPLTATSALDQFMGIRVSGTFGVF